MRGRVCICICAMSWGGGDDGKRRVCNVNACMLCVCVCARCADSDEAVRGAILRAIVYCTLLYYAKLCYALLCCYAYANLCHVSCYCILLWPSFNN